ncbi:hypothetical protein OPT61_g4875 [Boeremia exigua]|uniref:Uncharacterized protein n=1 Tax=Boeremia exigua TaxID=749465 RepID=A0ACC2ICJ5_9PLEO|nr:hypothetical protein OPT61_g4875 [Boeremia exigua]
MITAIKAKLKLKRTARAPKRMAALASPEDPALTAVDDEDITVDTPILEELAGTFIIDPDDGTRLHWCCGDPMKDQLEEFVQQCDQLCQRCLELAQLMSISRGGLRKASGSSPVETDIPRILRHHKTMMALEASAKSGCHFCCLLLDVVAASSRRTEYTLGFPLSLYMISIESEDGIRGFISLYNIPIPREHRPPMTLAIPGTNHPKVLDLARRWLHSCRTGHSQCCDLRSSRAPGGSDRPQSASGSFTPSRLVYIKASKGFIQSIRLVPKSALDHNCVYATLSHCWGGNDIIKLKEKSLRSFQTEIPLEELSRTFIEAIQVTVALGFCYLWIDSLCIIQDSKVDWLNESQQMGDVYRHSELTLAAVKAQNSHEGLFTNRTGRCLTPCQILGGSGQESMYARSRRFQDQPLYRRGWVVQERCLSRRILEFNSDQLSWECIESKASEAEPGFSRHNHVYPSLNSSIYSMLNQRPPVLSASTTSPSSMDDPMSISDHWLNHWWNIVCEYSACKLTYVEDRQPAIAGLANVIAQAKGLSTVLGLWQPYLLTELLWYCHHPAQRNLPIDAPSWTWLGIGRSVSHFYLGPRGDNRIGYHTTRSFAEVSFSNSGIVDDNTSTQTLKANAHMLHITTSKPVPEFKNTLYAQHAVYPFRLCDSRKLRSETMSEWDGHWYPDSLQNLDIDSELWALQIIQGVSSVKEKQNNFSVGLIVVAVDEARGHFKRVGCYKVLWREDGGIYHYFGDEEPYPLSKSWATRDGKRWFGERRTIYLV